jgi:hypothetical protein
MPGGLIGVAQPSHRHRPGPRPRRGPGRGPRPKPRPRAVPRNLRIIFADLGRAVHRACSAGGCTVVPPRSLARPSQVHVTYLFLVGVVRLGRASTGGPPPALRKAASGVRALLDMESEESGRSTFETARGRNWVRVSRKPRVMGSCTGPQHHQTALSLRCSATAPYRLA